MSGAADLIPRVEQARNGHQRAKDQFSEARGMLGKPEEPAPPPEEEGGGLFENLSFSDVGHTLLDGAGMIPGLGAFADGANAVWYAAEGDWTNAGLSAMGAIPIAGDAATAARLANRATDAVRAVDNATDAANATNDTFRLADNVEESMARADTIRQELGSGKGRNIGFADINIGGRSDTLKADSGPTPRPGGVGLPEKPMFETVETPVGHRRDLDSEYKILEEVAARHTDNPNVTGTVNLFTERPPCPSCTGVIDQFQRKFPNITLDVTHGGRR